MTSNYATSDSLTFESMTRHLKIEHKFLAEDELLYETSIIADVSFDTLMFSSSAFATG